MKNKIVATLTLLLTLVLAPVVLFAAQAVSIKAEAAQSTAIATSNADSKLEPKRKEDGRSITINFDSENDEKQDNVDYSGALATLDEVFGKEIGAQLSAEFENLDAEERKKLSELFSAKEADFDNMDFDGLGFGEFMVAMTAIIFSLGLPVIILLLVFIFGHRKRKQKMQVISSYLQADQPVPDNVMAEFGSSASASTPFHSGLKLALGGAAFSIAFIVIGDEDIAAFGLIPIAIGVARLIAWKVDSRQTDV